MLVATWGEREQRRAGFDRLFALGEAGVGLPFMASAQIGVRGGGGGAFSRSRAHQDPTVRSLSWRQRVGRAHPPPI